jgi:tRNA G18 (ribose-2'-O)-methylase SpoU
MEREQQIETILDYAKPRDEGFRIIATRSDGSKYIYQDSRKKHCIVLNCTEEQAILIETLRGHI